MLGPHAGEGDGRGVLAGPVRTGHAIGASGVTAGVRVQCEGQGDPWSRGGQGRQQRGLDPLELPGRLGRGAALADRVDDRPRLLRRQAHRSRGGLLREQRRRGQRPGGQGVGQTRGEVGEVDLGDRRRRRGARCLRLCVRRPRVSVRRLRAGVRALRIRGLDGRAVGMQPHPQRPRSRPLVDRESQQGGRGRMAQHEEGGVVIEIGVESGAGRGITGTASGIGGVSRCGGVLGQHPVDRMHGGRMSTGGDRGATDAAGADARRCGHGAPPAGTARPEQSRARAWCDCMGDGAAERWGAVPIGVPARPRMARPADAVQSCALRGAARCPGAELWTTPACGGLGGPAPVLVLAPVPAPILSRVSGRRPCGSRRAERGAR